ncbi:hypothetical protein, partial [Crossiella equi]|uniref:hypothetical protein n=1 Tax=Crossiella equi TaxID=130796 RepID=UPI001B80A7F9
IAEAATATGFHRAVPVEASAMPSRASASAYLPVPAELQGEFTGRCGPEITGEPDPFAASDEDPFGYARAMDATASASVLPEPPSYPDVEDPTEPQPRITDAPRDQAWTLPGRDGSPG